MPESTKWDARRARIALSYSCGFLCREFVTVDWQSTQSDSSRREERVRQGRGRRRCARFADAAWRLAALDEMNLDLGCLIDPQHAVIVEVALLYPTLVDVDFAVERGGQSEHQPALQLGDDGVGIHDDSAVDRRHDACQADFALLIDLRLHDGRDEAPESSRKGNTAAGAGCSRVAPAGLLGGQFQDRLKSGCLLEMRVPKRDRIHVGFLRQFVHETFDGEDVVVGSHPAPEARRYGRWLVSDVLDSKIGNVVGDVRAAIDRVDVDAFLERGRQPTGDNGGACDSMFPADDASVGNARRQSINIHWAINVVLNVFLSRPHDLDWPIDSFGDQHGFLDAVGFEPTPEASADQMIVNGHFIER